jgi:hypothetical protein
MKMKIGTFLTFIDAKNNEYEKKTFRFHSKIENAFKEII